MAEIPPVCDFNADAKNFKLLGVDRKYRDFNTIRGPNGTLIMFICNHCPYVLAVLDRIIRDAEDLKEYGIGVTAICSNDATTYPEDSFENMIKISKDNDFPFPYLHDPEQSAAKAFGAVCTPDFFGYNADAKLQYRGRLDASRKIVGADDLPRELFNAMVNISRTGLGPKEQNASMGCSIKWKKI